MADEFWPDVSPWITSTPNGARLCFAGHSLGGSMAMLLMAWSKLRLGVDPLRSVLDLRLPARAGVRRVGDAQAARRGHLRVGCSRRGGWRRLGRRAHARGRHGRRRGADAGEGRAGASTPGVDGDGIDAKDLPSGGRASRRGVRIGFRSRIRPLQRPGAEDVARGGSALRGGRRERDGGVADERRREWLFGRGMLSRGRFLYDAAGTLYWMRWAPEAGTAVTVHRGDPTRCARSSRGTDRASIGDGWMTRRLPRRVGRGAEGGGTGGTVVVGRGVEERRRRDGPQRAKLRGQHPVPQRQAVHG